MRPLRLLVLLAAAAVVVWLVRARGADRRAGAPGGHRRPSFDTWPPVPRNPAAPR